MANFIKEMFTDKDGITDDGRITAFMLVLAFIGNSVISVVMSTAHAFDAQSFGIGSGALVAGVGALLKLRGDN